MAREMTPEEAATIQARAAVAQTFLGVTIGAATAYFAYAANRLFKLQIDAQILPNVTLKPASLDC